jgi:Domain of unknown function (DUF4232)
VTRAAGCIAVALLAGAAACAPATPTRTATPRPTPSPSVATPGPGGQCVTAGLQIRLNNTQGAGGTVRGEFEARSLDGGCTLDGYATVVMVDADGNVLMTSAQDASGTTPATVSLAAGTQPLGSVASAGHAWFTVTWSDNDCPSTQASIPTAWRITVPGDTGSLDVSARDQSGALPVVCNGAVTVGPFQANK